MKIERNFIERIDISDFAERHGLTMKVYERGKNTMASMNISYPFYAYFENCEVKDGICLLSEYGNGTNEESAIREYAAVISDKKLIFNAYGPNRKEIDVPYLHYVPRRS